MTIVLNKMHFGFNEKQATPLCEIMGRNKSDKGDINILSSWHNYTPFYYSIFKDMREKKLRVFELGLGTNHVEIPSNMGKDGRPGASLYGWAEFFPNSNIYGADIDKAVLFDTDRINTFYCDQTNFQVINQMWNEPTLNDKFDIIIDDGLHTFNANVCFFENSIHKLKPNGYFIIEDICKYEEHLFIDKIKRWEAEYIDCYFKLVKIPSTTNDYDNILLVVYKLNVVNPDATEIVVEHNSGFFSCCSVKFAIIVQYINMYKKLPLKVDSSLQFEWYKLDKTKDITYDYFEKYENRPNIMFSPNINIAYYVGTQYIDYSLVQYDYLVPLLHKYFYPSTDIHTIIRHIEQEYTMDYANICVLFYRGNDKNTETLICGYGEYIEYAEKVLKENPNIKFLIQSDETEFIEQMTALYPTNSFYFKNKIRHISKSNTSVDMVFKHQNYEFSKYYLAITVIMSQCEYIICGSGNCSLWIMLYRGHCKNVYQSLDRKWITHTA